MAVTPAVLQWLRDYRIVSLLNTPCGPGGGSTSDMDLFCEAGVQSCHGVDLVNPVIPPYGTIRGKMKYVMEWGDLAVWKPSVSWDAAYINCLFCWHFGRPQPTTRQQIATNIASWPVSYIIMYDTKGVDDNAFDWEVIFREHGWVKIHEVPGPDGPTTFSQLWRREAGK